MHDANAIRPLSDREFRMLQQLIYREAGIHLSEAKKALVSGRLGRRVRALGCRDFTAYYEHVAADGVERTAMLDCISTNETRFFREPKQFEFLERVGAAALARASATPAGSRNGSAPGAPPARPARSRTRWRWCWRRTSRRQTAGRWRFSRPTSPRACSRPRATACGRSSAATTSRSGCARRTCCAACAARRAACARIRRCNR